MTKIFILVIIYKPYINPYRQLLAFKYNILFFPNLMRYIDIERIDEIIFALKR